MLSRILAPAQAWRPALALLLAAGLHAAVLLHGRQPPPRPAAAPALLTRMLPAQPGRGDASKTPVAATAAAAPPKLRSSPRPAAVARAPAVRAVAAVAASSPSATPPVALVFLPPPPLLWQYRLRRGAEQGQAWLHWQADAQGQRYQARLERQLGERVLPSWHSQGGFDASGLAPERFAELRGGRERQATNFRRPHALISFSASNEQLALPAGAQDRLSVLLQLAALLQAQPALQREGAQIALPVAGLRGPLMQWQFAVLGLGSGDLLLHLRRAAQAPYEPYVELWLDPARHHLPVRLRMGQGDQPPWEMELEHEMPQP